MPLEHHSLLKDFPELRDQIHHLKATDAHFAKLFNAYDTLEHEVYRIETGVTPASESYAEELKKQRLQVKDELYRLLTTS